MSEVPHGARISSDENKGATAVEILERNAREAADKEAAAPNESEATYYNGMVEAFREAARIVRGEA